MRSGVVAYALVRIFCFYKSIMAYSYGCRYVMPLYFCNNINPIL